MKIPVLLYLTTVACIFVFAVSGEARTWTRAADKKTLEGEFVKVEGDKVVISMGGKNVPIPIKLLTKEDQEFITAQTMGEDKGDGKKEVAKKGEKKEEKKAPAEMPKGPTEVVLGGVHLCCSKCEKRMEKALERYDDIKLEFDKDEGTVTFKGESGQAVEDALFKVHDAGFYGTTNHERLKMKKLGGSTKELEEVDVRSLHNCCGKCEKAIKNALKTVAGIDEHTLDKGKTSINIKGKFTIAEITKAFGDAGMSATITPPRN